MTLGLVCDACDALSPLSATVCSGCGEPLGVPQRASSQKNPIINPNGPGKEATTTPVAATRVAQGAAPVASTPAPAGAVPKCTSCGADLIPGHRFCGSCGTPVPSSQVQAGASKTMFFGAMQAPGRAKLILIKGEGMDGVSYHLAGSEHIAGRLEGAILFPEDPLLSPRHANFFYRDGKLIVSDENSANGVFVRIKTPVIVDSGASFLVGEQLLRLEASNPDAVPVPDGDGTYFYGSPKRPAKMSLVQQIVGGAAGMVFRARSEAISIGREGNDINFPDDPFISGRHAQVTALDGGRFQLADTGSKNGTFLRVRNEGTLLHGDYVFLGQQLLRVEIT
jgi:pSer/pThr/pTyr-binding forkhead associated (FHA) protein